MDTLQAARVIDTHCHLDFPQFDADRPAVIARCREGGVEAMVNVGSTVETSERAAALSREHAEIYACVGCHPHDADNFKPQDLEALEKLCAGRKVVGIGETGLDYYRNLSSVPNQKKVFEELVGLALARSLPLVVHTREAQEDTLAILKSHGVKRAVIHCFSGDIAFLGECVGLGYMVSFACNITYKKSSSLREAARHAPLESILVETDAPYLSAEGHRGERNEPWMCRLAAEEIAKAKGIPADAVCRQTTANAKRFFGIA
jgi:TatD DNase family protein